jgi:hypothetical protein
MSKKLFTLIQVLVLLGCIGRAYAENTTVDIYENGQNVGTMTIPAEQYPNLVNRMNGTGVTVRRQTPVPNPNDAAARRAAAQARMDQWNREFEQRHTAAQAQQDRWNQEFDRRHAAAQQMQENFVRENAARQAAAEQRQAMWQRQFEERHQAAQRGYAYWAATR